MSSPTQEEELPPMQSPKRSDPIYQKIVAARVHMIFDMQFFGGFAARLTEMQVNADWCTTAATDGRFFYYDREFIKGLDRDELCFVIGHEVLHCVLDHICRRGNRDPKLWNMAIDYIVNYMLVKEGIGKIGPHLSFVLYDKRYTDDMSAEHLYDLLKKNQVEIQMPLDYHFDMESDDGEGEQSEDGQPGAAGKKVKVTITGQNGPPVLTPEEMEKIRADILANTINAAVQATEPGSVPAGIWRKIEELVNPKLDWRSMLDVTIRSAQRDDFTFMRISRKSFSCMAILPGMSYLDTIDICVAFDTSGSVSPEMIRDFLSETKGIMQTFRDFRLRMWCFDGVVDPSTYQEFTGENIDEIDDYAFKRITGGGGTVLESNWDYMKQEGIEPVRFVLFTDGDVGSWGVEGYCDTLFVVHSNPTKRANFGITTHYTPSNDNRRKASMMAQAA